VHGEAHGELSQVQFELLDVDSIGLDVIVEFCQQTNRKHCLQCHPHYGFPQNFGLSQVGYFELGHIGFVHGHDAEADHVLFQLDLLVLILSEFLEQVDLLEFLLLMDDQLLLEHVLGDGRGGIHPSF
jgi:hypothetical protein